MKYVCELCGLVYDEAQGDPQHGIAPGTLFSQLPEHYECPGCYSEKQAFSPLGHKQTLAPREVTAAEPQPQRESER